MNRLRSRHQDAHGQDCNKGLLAGGGVSERDSSRGFQSDSVPDSALVFARVLQRAAAVPE